MNNLTTYIILLIAFILIVFGLTMYIRLMKKIKIGIKTKGTIVKSEKIRNSSFQGGTELSDIYYKYKIEYFVDGECFIEWSDYQTQKILNNGTKIEVIYNYENPKDFLIMPGSQIRLSIFFMFIGFLMTLITGCMVIYQTW